MEHLKSKNIHNTSLLFILIAPITVLYYASYVFNPLNADNIFLYVLQVIADAISVFIVGSLWVTIILDIILPEQHKRKIKHHMSWIINAKPTIDILIPTSHESFELIEKTITAAVEMDYPHTTYVLDDSNSPYIKNVATKQGITYIARPEDKKMFAKSGNLNYGLAHATGDFFAVFDADHIPKKSFLTELLPFFENVKVALVQTPQSFINTSNYIASGTAQAQEIFYTFIQPAKNSYNAAFCVGTNMIYRRSAIDAIGGIRLLEHSEDIWTSILLHENGFESVYYNKVLAQGRAPTTIKSFFRQQNRWAQGGFSLFFTHNPLFISELTIDQRVQYLFSNIHYFIAFSITIYLFIPIIYLLFGIYPFHIHENHGWIYHYIPYFLTVYFLPFFLLGKMQVSTISTALSSFVPYLTAFFTIATKSNYRWVATESKIVTLHLVSLELVPHVFVIILSLCAILVGWYNITDYQTTLVTTLWVFINAYLLFNFIKNGIVT